MSSYVAPDLLSECTLHVCPDVSIASQSLTHPRSLPGYEHSAVLWRAEVGPSHWLHFSDDMWCLEEVIEDLFETNSLGERELVCRHQMQMR